MAYMNGKEVLFSANVTASTVEVVQTTGDSETAVMSQKAVTENIIPPIIQSASGESILVTDSANRSLRGLRIFGKTAQTDTSEEVVTIGKNLLPTPYADGDTTINGLTYANNDGELSISGTATDSTSYNIGTVDLEAGTYTLSRAERIADYDMFGSNWNVSADGITFVEEDMSNPSITFILSESTSVSISIDTWGGSEGVDVVEQIQLEEGDTATEWEAYTEITETITNTEFSNVGDSGSIAVSITDGADESQTLDVITSDGLAGLILSDTAYRVGNETYIDADGNYIASDEVDFAKGVHIQRIDRVVYDGSEDETWICNGSLFYIAETSILNRKYGGMIYASGYTYKRSADENGECTVSDRLYFFNDTWSADTDPLVGWREHLAENPMTVYYVLATPIETALSSDQMGAFKNLYSQYPNTSVVNDSEAHMEIKYVADTKLYIDNKFAELASATTTTEAQEVSE